MQTTQLDSTSDLEHLCSLLGTETNNDVCSNNDFTDLQKMGGFCGPSGGQV